MPRTARSRVPRASRRAGRAPARSALSTTGASRASRRTASGRTARRPRAPCRRGTATVVLPGRGGTRRAAARRARRRRWCAAQAVPPRRRPRATRATPTASERHLVVEAGTTPDVRLADDGKEDRTAGVVAGTHSGRDPGTTGMRRAFEDQHIGIGLHARSDRNESRAETACNGNGVAAGRRVVLDDGRTPMSVPAVQERLGKCADDDRDVYRVPPGAEVPPLDVSGVQAIFGRAAIGLVAVDEVEPVVLRRQRPANAVDRLDVPAAVARGDVGAAGTCVTVSTWAPR